MRVTSFSMGAGNSVFKEDYKDALQLLNVEEQRSIIESFRTYAGDKGKKVDRPSFTKLLTTLRIPAISSDRLFEVFDRKKTGFVDLEELICGLSVLQHGTFRDKCKMLFRIFNLDGDEGVSREELRAVLTGVIKSANNFMDANQGSDDIGVVVQKIVDKAFEECDISQTGTLLPAEFEYWVKKNPAVIESLFGWFLFDDEGQSTEDEQVDTHPPQQSLSLSDEDWQSEKDFICSIWPLPQQLWEFFGDKTVRSVAQEAVLCCPVVKYHHVQSSVTLSKDLYGDAEKVFKEIRDLVNDEHYKSACWLTGEILMSAGDSVSPFILQLWICRFSLMCYLGMYDSVAAELEGFGNLDQVNLFYEYWPDKFKLKAGSLVPFSLRMLHAQIPLMQVEPNPSKALDRVYLLKASTEKVCVSIKESPEKYGLKAPYFKEAEKLWKSRLLQVSLLAVQCFIALKDYDLAAQEIQTCCKVFETKQVELQMLLCRVYLMLGDLDLASQIVESQCHQHGQDILHQCFIPLFEGNTDEALSRAKVALKDNPDNPLAVNNLAVCLFHAHQPMEAVRTLEAFVTGHEPQKAMMDNLFLAYELESLDSNSRKQLLLSRTSTPKP